MRAVESWAEVGERVRAARMAAALTQEQLASRIQVNRTALVRIEAGEQGLSALVLSRLAEALDIPVAHFVTRSPGPVAAYRVAAEEAVDRGVDAQAEHTRFFLDAALEAHGRDAEWLHINGFIDAVPPLPTGRLTSREDALRLARDARDKLGKPTQPLDSIASAAEKFGLYMKVLDKGSAGASLLVDDGVGVAVVGGAAEPGRRRSTAAHELGHHLFGDRYNSDAGVAAGDRDRERLIDQFVAELLLPEDVLKARIAPGEPVEEVRNTLVALAGEYRLSWSAAINSLRWADLVSSISAQRLGASSPGRGDFMAVLGYEPVPDLTKGCSGPVWRRAVLEAWRTYRITGDRAVDLLNGSLVREELPAREGGQDPE